MAASGLSAQAKKSARSAGSESEPDASGLVSEDLAFRDPVDAGGYAVIYHCMTRDPLLSDGAFRTWCLLLSYAWQSNACWPGQPRLAIQRGCDVRTVRRHLDELQELGLLTIERRGDKKTNRYVLENIHAAYKEREDKNVPSPDRTQMSGHDRSKMSAPVTGQKCPPKSKQIQNKADRKRNSSNREPDGLFAASNEIDSAAAALIASLEEAEVNSADAKRLAIEKPDECKRQLSFLPFVESFKSSKGAYLRSAIEGGFGPPNGWKEAQKRQEAGQTRARQAQMNEAQKEADALRQMTLEAEKARLQSDAPEVWVALVAQAEASLAAPIRSRPDGPAYKPALDAKINTLVAALRNTIPAPVETGNAR